MSHFATFFRNIQARVWLTSEEHGFHQPPTGTLPSEKIALIHSELSEALEALRLPDWRDRKSEKLSIYSEVTEELADAVIRIMDLAEILRLDLAGAIVAKADYNEKRPYKHGKVF